MRTGLLLRSTLFLAGWVAIVAQAKPPYACVHNGKTTYQQTPCRDEPPATPVSSKPKLACPLSEDQVRRASRLENQFLTRYPEEPKHREAQDKAIQPVADRIRDAEVRLRDLGEQRKPLDKDREFYVGKPMPSALKSKIDANDAQTAAMTDILRGRKQELADIQARYQCERATFGMMWKGAAPGSSACNRPACAQP